MPAEPTGSTESAPDSILLPTGPFRDGAVPGRVVEGAVTRRAWRLAAPSETTLALLSPLRDQIAAQGYRVVYDCATSACGGFDFRFALDLFPEPDMHVDLGDFRFLSAERGPGEAVEVVVSRSTGAGYVQITSVRPAALPPVPQALPDPPGADTPAATLPPPARGPATADFTPATGETAGAAPPEILSDIGAGLRANGHVVLSDLIFATGSAELTPGDFASLAALAAWLAENPEARIAFVGHTDAAGGLEANIALSRRRAEAVRRRLIDIHGVPGDRLSAQGVGYLAPRISNATEEGRALNRRVEAVLVGG